MSVNLTPKGDGAADLIKNACERVSPVDASRKNRGTRPFTNDGELAKRLTHFRWLRELYHITLAKKATPEQLEQLKKGSCLQRERESEEAAFVTPAKWASRSTAAEAGLCGLREQGTR